MKHLAQLLRAAVSRSRRLKQASPGRCDAGHLARVGQCLSCGEPVAAHYDVRSNRLGGCLHAAIVARRAARVLREPHPVTRGEDSRERPSA